MRFDFPYVVRVEIQKPVSIRITRRFPPRYRRIMDAVVARLPAEWPMLWKNMVFAGLRNNPSYMEGDPSERDVMDRVMMHYLENRDAVDLAWRIIDEECAKARLAGIWRNGRGSRTRSEATR